MKKRGFTLIEIIISIALITIIGTASFFGVRLINKTIRINKLEQITDKALEAAQIYIETNKEAYNQLYNNSNGVSVPLQLLVNEGLLNIDNTDLTINDLKDEYVVTFLGGSGETENCEQITSSASWANDKPLFLCMNNNGSSNLAFIDPNKYGNLTTVSNEAYYYKGKYPNNYAKYGSYNMRILSVDTDDSITIIVNYKSLPELNKIFSDKMVFGFNSNTTGYYGESISSLCGTYGLSSVYSKTYGGFFITSKEYYNATECLTLHDKVDSNLYDFVFAYSYGVDQTWLQSGDIYLHLKPCMKITSGTGVSDNPYIIENKGC